MTRKLAWFSRAVAAMAAIKEVSTRHWWSRNIYRMVAGISIGAINAAVIAGNAPEHRVQRLRSFWEEITARTSLWRSAPDGPIVEWQQWAGALTALCVVNLVF